MIKVGQTWARRDGRAVHVLKKDGCNWLVGDGRWHYAVCAEGRPIFWRNGDVAELTARMPRLYIAGPMTGHDGLNFPAFNAAAAKYRARGCFVLNPAELVPEQGTPWDECMRKDIAALVTCEEIVMLPGWQRSKGARLEHEIAIGLGMSIIYPDHFGAN